MLNERECKDSNRSSSEKKRNNLSKKEHSKKAWCCLKIYLLSRLLSRVLKKVVIEKMWKPGEKLTFASRPPLLSKIFFFF